MRKLVFDKSEDESKKRFEVILHSLFVLGNTNTSKGLTVLRTEISLLDKLETISAPCECGKKIPGTQETDRELVEGISNMPLPDIEFDLIYDYISKVPWSIGESSRLALRTLEWIKSSYDKPSSKAS